MSENGSEVFAPEQQQDEKKEHTSENVSISQAFGMKNLAWAVGLLTTTAVFAIMSIIAWIGVIMSYNDWRYADAGTNKELFRREFLNAQKDFLQHVDYRYDLVWYAFARETLNITVVSTIAAAAFGYGWLIFFGRRDTQSALKIGYNVAMFGSIISVLFCLFQKSTLILAAVEAALGVYMFIRRKPVVEPLVGEDESGRTLSNALEPVQKNPTLLVIPMLSLALEVVIQLSVFACWSFWVKDWRMWFTWILSIWMLDALHMATLGAIIKSIEAAQSTGSLTTSQALAFAGKAFLQVVVLDLGSISSLSFLWMPLRLVAEVGSMLCGYISAFASIVEPIARIKSPFSVIYIALRNCDSASASDASNKLVANSGSSLLKSPSTIYTSTPAGEYQTLVTNAFRLIGFSLSYVASAYCEIPFNVTFWVCFSCSSICAYLAGSLCTIIDGMLCYSHVNTFRS